METTLTTTPVFSEAPPKATRQAYPTIAQSWGVLGWFLLISLAAGGPAYLLLDRVLHVPRQTTQVVLSMLINIVLILVLRRKAGTQWSLMQLKGQAKPWLYAVLPILIITNGLLVSTIVTSLHLPNWLETSFRDLVKQPLLGLFLFCVSAPVLEELIFRGVVLTGLLRNYRPWVAIGQSALLFGLMHLNPAQIVGAGLLGLLLGWLYYRTRSLGLCMAAHAVNNLFGFFAMRANTSKQKTLHDVFGSNAALTLTLLVSAAILSILLWWIYKATEGGSSLAAATPVLPLAIDSE